MKKILVVDDYLPFLEEMERTSKAEDITVSSATTAREAIQKLDKEDYDLVVTDLFMETQKVEDGLAVLKAAKRNETVQVIVVTAYGRPEFSVETMRLGAFDYIERGSPGTNFRSMLANKIRIALDYQTAKRCMMAG